MYKVVDTYYEIGSDRIETAQRVLEELYSSTNEDEFAYLDWYPIVDETPFLSFSAPHYRGDINVMVSFEGMYVKVEILEMVE